MMTVKLQVPSSKLQRSSKPQTPKRRLRCCHCLVVGAWCLFGAFSARSADAPTVTTRDTVRVDEKTDQVIKGALKWLASKQAPNGAWGSTEMEQQHPIAMTGYALMAFQAAGQLPGEGEY